MIDNGGTATKSAPLRVRDAVAYLADHGYPCCAGTVRALAKANKLKAFRPGVTGKGPMVFTVHQLDAFLRLAELGTDAKPSAPVVRAERKPRPVKVAVAKPIVSDWRDELKREMEA